MAILTLEKASKVGSGYFNDSNVLPGMHVILDFIPNHTSNTSWVFQKSVNDSRGPYADAFIWRDPAGLNADGNPIPPNNWVKTILKTTIPCA